MGVGYLIISKGICSPQIMSRRVLLAIYDNACLILYKLCHVIISAAVYYNRILWCHVYVQE